MDNFKFDSNGDTKKENSTGFTFSGTPGGEQYDAVASGDTTEIKLPEKTQTVATDDRVYEQEIERIEENYGDNDFVIGSDFNVDGVNAVPKKKKKKNRTLKSLIAVSVLLVMAVLIAVGIIDMGVDYLGLGKDKIVQITISEGMTSSQIAKELEQRGAIKHAWLFRLYTKLRHYDNTLRMGVYQFNNSIGYDGIIRNLQVGNERESVTVRIPEGANIKEIMSLLEENGVCTKQQFANAMNDGKYNYDFVTRIPNDVRYRFEGYLYPDTYEFFTGSTYENAELAIDSMLSNFNSHLPSGYKDKIKQLKKYGIENLNDVLALASIVQLECNGNSESDMSKVAAVFLNRLNWKDEPHFLGSTPTYYYPDNRYNTNAAAAEKGTKAGHEGLPPGAQCSMTDTAISAVLNPSGKYLDKGYYYFVTDSNGKFYFNKTLSQHNSTISSLKSQGKWKG